MNDMHSGMEMGGNMEGHMMEGGHMDMGMGMMGMESGPMVLGYPLSVVLMIASGVFYLACAISIWKPFRKEKNELVGALFAFLSYQAISMFFMGVEMHTMNMVYSNIAALAIFIGSAYMLKFPLSSLSEKARKVSFLLVLIVALGVFGWFMGTEARQMQLMSAVLWYDLIVNGIIVGGSMIVFGIRAIDRKAKAKAIGGGTGVMSCCIISNIAMLSGALFTSTIFAFLAPVFILWSLRSTTVKPQAGDVVTAA